jgi:Glycosyltransferase family 87
MSEQSIQARRTRLRSILDDRMLWVWGAIWIATLALMVVQVGFWNHVTGINYQDTDQYTLWSEILAHQHTMPPEDTWQYPPGAAFLLLLPRIGVAWFGVIYQQSFIVTMVLADLAGLGVMVHLARRTGRRTGVWVWLLAMPLLQAFPILRFDLVPTVLVMAALVIVHRRPAWFGALVGIGASIKVWPVVALLGEWDRRRLAIGAVVAAAVIALSFLMAGVLFGDQSAFFDNQDTRGLEVEAVGASPWYVRQAITGKVAPTVERSGSLEIGSGLADAVAVALKWLGLLVLLAAALWWVARERAIRRGRLDLADAAVSIDFVFTVVVLQIVVSRVLSPQYMIWLIGLAAVVLSAGTRRLARPAWVVIGAVILTAGLYQTPLSMVIRNLGLLIASLDGALAMLVLLRGPTAARRVPVRGQLISTPPEVIASP